MKTFCATVILLILMVGSVPAGASPILDFQITPSGAIYNVGSSPLFGALQITGVDYGSLYLPNLVAGRLIFKTGKLIGVKPNEWLFGGGGLINLTGCLDWNSDHDKACDNKDFRGTLLTGKFINAEVISVKPGEYTLEALLVETVSPRLARFLHMPSGGESQIEIGFIGKGTPGRITSTKITGGYIKDLSSVPEPASFILFGSGLALMGALGFRKKLKGPVAPANL